MNTTLLLVAASMVAASTDLVWRRIPNVLTFGLAAIAVAVAIPHGLWAVGTALLLYVAVLVAGTIPFGAGWIGGGDVKLMAAGAACAGYPGCLTFLLATSLAGGVLALITLARAGRLRVALAQVAIAASSGTLSPSITLDPERHKLPYALAIAAGALFLFASETCPWLQLAHV